MEEIFSRFKSLPRPTKTYHTKSYPSISPARPELSLAGKTVLITGGSEGIGLETAKAFAQANTSTIALLARRQDRLDAAQGEIEKEFPKTKVLTFAASMSDTKRLVEIVAELKMIDILVLNAAYVPTPGPVLDFDPDTIAETFATNITGPITLIKAFKDLPSPANESRTVIHTSTSGIQLTVPYMGLYNASKIAMTSMIHNIHEEAQSTGIRVHTFHPAFGFTPGSRDIMGLKEDQFEYDSLSLPAHYAVWLCSKEADFLKGRYTWAHWDVDEMKAKQEEIVKDYTALKVGVVVDSVKA